MTPTMENPANVRDHRCGVTTLWFIGAPSMLAALATDHRPCEDTHDPEARSPGHRGRRRHDFALARAVERTRGDEGAEAGGVRGLLPLLRRDTRRADRQPLPPDGRWSPHQPEATAPDRRVDRGVR